MKEIASLIAVCSQQSRMFSTSISFEDGSMYWIVAKAINASEFADYEVRMIDMQNVFGRGSEYSVYDLNSTGLPAPAQVYRSGSLSLTGHNCLMTPLH